MVENMKFKLDGLHCGNCAMKVQYKLKQINGVNKVAVNLTKGEAIVEYNPNATGFNAFQVAIQETGYRASR